MNELKENGVRLQLHHGHPCVNTSSLKIRTADIFAKFLESVHHSYTVVHLTGE